MNKIILLLMGIILLGASYVSGQFSYKIGDTSQLLNEYLQEAIKRVKLPDNQYVYITDKGIIVLIGFLKEEQLLNKEAVAVATRKQSMYIYNLLKEGSLHGKRLYIDEVSFSHYYFNRSFMQYGKCLLSTCIVGGSDIKGFDMQWGKEKSPTDIPLDIYKKLSLFVLKPNQYMGQHKLEKQTLVLMNTVVDFSVDRTNESKGEVKRFKKAVKSISPYNRILIRYQSKYNPKQGRDYYSSL